jgi:hypothetical protein
LGGFVLAHRQDPLNRSDRDDVERQPLLSLKLELSLDHQVSHLIEVVGINGHPEMGRSGIVRGRGNFKRGLGVALAQEPLELSQCALHSRIMSWNVLSTHVVSPLACGTASMNCRARLRARLGLAWLTCGMM